jgi:Undecaprenyl-phosphate glucose phosphotransferase
MHGRVSDEALDAGAHPRGGCEQRLLGPSIPALIAVLDVLAVTITGIAVYAGYLGWSSYDNQQYVAAAAIFAGLTAGLYGHGKLYDFETVATWPGTLSRLLTLSTAAFLALVVIAFALKISAEFSRVWFFSTWLVSTAVSCGVRVAFRCRIDAWGRSGLLVRRVAVVGTGRQAHQLLTRIDAGDGHWKRIIGVFDDRRVSAGQTIAGKRVVGDLEDLARRVRLGQVDDVIVALPWSAEGRLAEICERLRQLPVHLYLGSDLIGYRFVPRLQQRWGGALLFEIAASPYSDWKWLVKLAEDKFLAGLGLLVMGPLMALIAFAIRLESPGPALFRQKRYGFNNEIITVYKFRSMRANDCSNPVSPQAIRDDPRVTRVGRFLRRTSLDELPQLLNVLEGSMSLVGPRPHPVALNEKYAELIGGYHGRHKVKPGITGWAQVNGHRGETETVEKMAARVAHDIHYIENWSLGFDLWILLRTMVVGFVHRNAY